MTNQIQIFKSQEFGAIRTMSNEQCETLFCAKDVCHALGYKRATNAIAQHVDKKDALKQGTPTTGGNQMMLYVKESGLYALILASKLDSAKRFKRWVTSEVLPSIRKQGGYMVAKEGETDEQVLARAVRIMHQAISERDEQIAKLQPRAEYADSVLDSITCITTTQLAKELGMTAQELNRRLCEMRIQYWQSGQYMLYADYARMGLAKTRTRKHVLKHGMVLTEMYLVWTERGRDFIHQLLDKKLGN